MSSSLENAVKCLKDGGVGVLPTDTLYGLVARADNKTAVNRLYELKKRENKPGTLIAANIEQLIKLGLPEQELKKVSYLWPNPISVVLPVNNLEYLHQNVGKIAVRVVGDKATKDVLMKTGPLMTSSANLPDLPSSTTIQMARNYFGDKVDFYVNGGDLSDRQPSTIIGFENDKLIIYREGAMSKQEIEVLINANR